MSLLTYNMMEIKYMLYVFNRVKKFLLLSTFLLIGNAFADVDFKKSVKPLLDKYCVSCHGPEKQKAKLRMDTLNPDMVKGHDAEMWQEALDLINISDMPPEKSKAQPTRAERQLMVDWLTENLRKAMESKRSTGGRNVMRRLTSYEYNNTLKDLLKMDLDFAEDLPHEGTAKEGFKNNNSILGTSALHIEYFERIGRHALEKIILVPEKAPKVYSLLAEPELVVNEKPKAAKKKKKPKKGKGKPAEEAPKKAEELIAGKCYSKKINTPKGSYTGAKKAPLISVNYGEILKDKGILLAGNRDIDKIKDIFAQDSKKGGAQGDGRSGYQPSLRLELWEYPSTGPIRIRIKAAAVPGKGGTYPRLSYELGAFTGAGFSSQKEGANFEVRAPMNKPQVFEFVVMGENFPFQSNKPSRPSYFRIFNDFRRGTSKVAYKDLPKLFIDSVEIVCNHHESWPPKATKNILIDSKNKSNETVYAGEILKRFMNRAYRRPVAQYEIDRKVSLFKKLRPQGDFTSTLISTLSSVLCSPHFLMIAEPQSAESERKLNNFELASRLSYFLWSTMPDDTLFRLAAQRKLTNPEILRTQVRRMIKDSRSEEFVRNFTSQWLNLEGIHSIAINPEYFTFPTKHKHLFAEESIAFVDHVLKNNLSIENFIHSDFAILNPIMASLYRIPNISGGGFQPVALKPEQHRGGLLTHASVLFGNSTGSDTHPIKRGVWLLERMLDDPPPPPPPSVPDLPEPEPGETGHLSLKERLIVHAETESCNDCHAKIDPWGVAFENYNALGQWREGSKDTLVKPKFQKVAIDPTTKLKNGRKIENLMDLKLYILNDRKNQLTKAVVNKVLSYSVGRYLEFSDQKTINDICDKVSNDNLKFQSLIEHVVLSEPFLTK